LGNLLLPFSKHGRTFIRYIIHTHIRIYTTYINTYIRTQTRTYTRNDKYLTIR
jgi:hypothetical protein